MKSLHFCTPEKLREIKTFPEFESIRTGWIPQLYPHDIIKINERDEKGDHLLFKAKVLSVTPKKFCELDQELHQEEIARYKKKFHPEQYFFLIRFINIEWEDDWE